MGWQRFPETRPKGVHGGHDEGTVRYPHPSDRDPAGDGGDL